jgi:ParB-like chromosome segregation protein Spo0J
MATNINAGSDVKRGDLFWVDPSEIIVREELRGRAAPPSEEKIIAMAESILRETQLQPVKCRRNADKRLVLTAGFTRCAAARLIRDGFTGSDEEFHKQPEFRLQVCISDMPDDQAKLANIAENALRNDTNPIDDAINQEWIRQTLGLSNAEIGRRYYRDKAGVKVGKCARLLTLDKDAQDLVASGDLSVDAALSMLDLPESQRNEIVALAAKKEQKVTGADVKRQVREHHLRDQHDAEPTDDGKEPQAMAPSGKSPKLPLSIKEVRSFFETLTTADDSVEEAAWIPAVQKFAKDVQSWLAGKKSDKSMCKAIGKLLAGTPEKDE